MINRRIFLKTAMVGTITTIVNQNIQATTEALSLHSFPEQKSNESIQQESFHIFLTMGQSNMAGSGELLPEDKIEIDGAYMLRDFDDPADKYNWVPAKQPINSYLKSDRFCLAGPFAKAHRDLYPRVTVGLVPMAWGGASITQINKGTPFYQEMIDKALWAKKQGVLKALLWHQGESDTVSEELADLYEARLTQLINDIRTDLDESELIVIIGNLAEFYGTGKDHSEPKRVKRIKKVKDSLRNVSEKLSDVAFVESKGLRSFDHHQVHFDRESYVIFGERYLDVYWTMINQKSNK